jgi:mannose-6-phosphate isomerase-like protein (cupin superfamily)
MSKFGKVWGSTEVLLKTPLFEMHRLSILPNAECSNHKHQFKWNGFFVVSGRLSILVERNDYALTDVTELGPGEFTTVRPGEFHRFRTGAEPVQAIEIYVGTARQWLSLLLRRMWIRADLPSRLCLRVTISAADLRRQCQI